MTCLSLINHLSTPFKNSGLTQSKILTTTTRSPGASCCQCFSNDNKTRDLALRPLEYCASQCKHQEVMEIQPPGFFMSKPKQGLDKKEDMLKKEKGNHDNETSEACFWGKSPTSFQGDKCEVTLNLDVNLMELQSAWKIEICYWHGNLPWSPRIDPIISPKCCRKFTSIPEGTGIHIANDPRWTSPALSWNFCHCHFLMHLGWLAHRDS